MLMMPVMMGGGPVLSPGLASRWADARKGHDGGGQGVPRAAVWLGGGTTFSSLGQAASVPVHFSGLSQRSVAFLQAAEAEGHGGA